MYKHYGIRLALVQAVNMGLVHVMVMIIPAAGNGTQLSSQRLPGHFSYSLGMRLLSCQCHQR